MSGQAPVRSRDAIPMAPLKLVLLLILALIIVAPFLPIVRVAASSSAAAAVSDSVALEIELDHFRSRIASLEARIGERGDELRAKDDSIKQMEQKIQEKAQYTQILNSQIEALQKGTFETKHLKAENNARFEELSYQVDILKKEVEAQEKKKETLALRSSKAEKMIKELNLRLESLQKISDEQRTRISKIKYDIQVAEDQLMKIKIEGSSVSEVMNQISKAWFPWFMVHIRQCMSYMKAFWTEYGRPSLDWAIQKALDVEAIVESWADPYIKAIKKDWIPMMMQNWLVLVDYLEPHLAVLQETTKPYFQEVKKFLRPHLTRFSVTSKSKPHHEKISARFKSYSGNIVQSYRKLMKSFMAQHTQVQVIVLELLQVHEFTRPFAKKGVVWYLASAIFSLPAILIVNLFTCFVSNRPKRGTQKYYARRRAKRSRHDN